MYNRLGGGITGQIEYVQVQVTVRTLLNRADTDGDGLNDSEELNLGSDGFSRDPWKRDTDRDVVRDDVDLALAAPSCALSHADAMVGVTCENRLAPLVAPGGPNWWLRAQPRAW